MKNKDLVIDLSDYKIEVTMPKTVLWKLKLFGWIVKFAAWLIGFGGIKVDEE